MEVRHAFPDIVLDPYYRVYTGSNTLYIINDYETRWVTVRSSWWSEWNGIGSLSIQDFTWIYDRVVMLVKWVNTWHNNDDNKQWQLGIAEFFSDLVSYENKTGLYRTYIFNIPVDKRHYVHSLSHTILVSTSPNCYKPGILVANGIYDTVLFYET